MNDQTRNYQQIEDIVATCSYEQIPELISRFLDDKDKQSLKELLIQLLFQEDIDNIKEDYRNYPSIFIKSILKEGWTGYNNLSYSQIIREFIARESLTDHPLYLENDEAEILESTLITEAVNSETEVSKKVEDYSFSLLQEASKAFLCQPLPDNWSQLTSSQQNNFLADNLWQPLEHFSLDEIWHLIENYRDSLQNFIDKLEESENEKY
jgi:hypothetical protein